MRGLTIATLWALLAGGGAAVAAKEDFSPQPVVGERRCPAQPAWLRSVKAEFNLVEIPWQPAGWGDAHQAALAFYEHHDATYQATGMKTELVGFLVRNAQGRHWFTNAVAVPYAFRLTASIDKPRDWTVVSLLHTHPGGRRCQEEFSIEDREAVLRGAVPGNYVRTPLGNVLFVDSQLATATRIARGATGVSVCANHAPCLAAHREAIDPVQSASR